MTIGFDLCHDLDLKFSRSNIEFAISQPKMGRLPRNEKQTYRLNSKASNVTIRLDLDHNLDLWIFKVKCDFDLWPHTWLWPWIFMVKVLNSCISEWEGQLTLHKWGISRSFMTMTMTIWWPRSGVWIYQIVTGVTSVVGVPSTHLVLRISFRITSLILSQSRGGPNSVEFWCLMAEVALENVNSEIVTSLRKDLIDDNSTLIQVITWCHQATSHYRSQCWPRSTLS